MATVRTIWSTNSILARSATGPFLRGWYWTSEPFSRLVSREITWQTTMNLLAQGTWMIMIWAIFGGAIARIAALHLTRNETLSPIAAMQDAITVWPSTTGSPLIALLGALALTVPLVLVGFLLRLDVVAALAGLMWGLVLAWGLMLAVVFVGLWIGWPMMWACLGVERSDAFDGVSRCYAYVYQKPLQLAFYIVIAVLFAFLGEAVVNVFAVAAVSLAEWTLSWGTGSETGNKLLSADLSGSPTSLSIRAIHAWKWGVASLLASFPLACLWSYSVGIYLLMRRHVDATEMDEVTLSDGTKQAGLPKLKEKESGVPEVEQPTSNGDAKQNEQ